MNSSNWFKRFGFVNKSFSEFTEEPPELDVEEFCEFETIFFSANFFVLGEETSEENAEDKEKGDEEKTEEMLAEFLSLNWLYRVPSKFSSSEKRASNCSFFAYEKIKFRRKYFGNFSREKGYLPGLCQQLFGQFLIGEGLSSRCTNCQLVFLNFLEIHPKFPKNSGPTGTRIGIGYKFVELNPTHFQPDTGRIHCTNLYRKK